MNRSNVAGPRIFSTTALVHSTALGAGLVVPSEEVLGNEWTVGLIGIEVGIMVCLRKGEIGVSVRLPVI
jgi:hypothetical protein